MKKTIAAALLAMMILILPLAAARETQYSWGKDRDQYGCMTSKGQVYCERLGKCINPKSQSCEGLLGRGSQWYSGTNTLQKPNLRVTQKLGLTQTEGKTAKQAAAQGFGSKMIISGSTRGFYEETPGTKITASSYPWASSISKGRQRNDKPIYAATGRRVGTFASLASIYSN